MNNFSSSSNVIVYSLNGKSQKIRSVNSGSKVSFLVPNRIDQSKTQFYICSNGSVKNINTITKVSSTGRFTDYLNQEKDDAFLMIYNKLLKTSVNQYKLYRESTGFNVVDVEVSELFDQFGGGIPSHSLGIKRYIKFIYDQWVSKPKNILLVGKGIRQATESSQGQNPGTRKSKQVYQNSLLPSIGYPSSDILYVDDLINLQNIPISIGRISVNNNNELTSYLNKVVAYENAFSLPRTVNDRIWMKNVIHFGGGDNVSEQNIFKSFLSRYEKIIEGPSFGGNVSSFYKTSSDPVGVIESDEIRGRIKEGVNLMCFFGHGSGKWF